MIQSDTSRAMQEALDAAQDAADHGEVPVGAVILGPDGCVLAIARNRVEEIHDASAHAELLAMREAARKLGSTRLNGCTLIVTLEPCPMCAAAIVHFRIERVVFGAYDPKGGGVEHGPRIFERPGCLHRPEVVGGLRETEASNQLKRFFQALRITKDVCLTDVSRARQLVEREHSP
ncbi:nucleoside deaminase [Gluconobacter wancherniae]|uniref:nucleoside deaminase n=1 Tax=Gluconobacter wancherniae TaxID=1307955 RepID=UPI001B8B58F6|nr:nucleoside deaminase [Gluconobacter wancherniae]MBS1094754.1 nucleoside deaminase [Gluconobacter wancherniae]